MVFWAFATEAQLLLFFLGLGEGLLMRLGARDIPEDEDRSTSWKGALARQRQSSLLMSGCGAAEGGVGFHEPEC